MRDGTLNRVVFVAAGLVLAMVAYFQLVMHLAPCELCLNERLPWYAALVLGAVGIGSGDRVPAGIWACLWLLLFLASAALAFYHVGVETRLLPGPTECTAPSLRGLDPKAALERLMNTKAVPCDVVQWSVLGISLAGWNALASLGLTILAVSSLLRKVS